MLIFFGDFFEYFVFVIVFDSIIVVNVFVEKDKLFFFVKYMSGKVNEVIKGFLVINFDIVYIEVWKLFD